MLKNDQRQAICLCSLDTFKIPPMSFTKVKPITQISSRADQTADFSDWKPLFSNQRYRIRAAGVHCAVLFKACSRSDFGRACFHRHRSWLNGGRCVCAQPFRFLSRQTDTLSKSEWELATSWSKSALTVIWVFPACADKPSPLLAHKRAESEIAPTDEPAGPRRERETHAQREIDERTSYSFISSFSHWPLALTVNHSSR